LLEGLLLDGLLDNDRGNGSVTLNILQTLLNICTWSGVEGAAEPDEKDSSGPEGPIHGSGDRLTKRHLDFPNSHLPMGRGIELFTYQTPTREWFHGWRATPALQRLLLVQSTGEVTQALLEERAQIGHQDPSVNERRLANATIPDFCTELLQYLTPPGFLFTTNRKCVRGLQMGWRHRATGI